MSKAKSFNFTGLSLTMQDSLVVKAFRLKPRKGNSQTSLTWDVIKVNKKSIVLQAYPTNETIKIKIEKI